MKKINFERWAAIAICAAAGIFAIFALFKYALDIILPFLVGIGLGAIAKSCAAHIIKGRKGQKLLGALIYISLLGAICVGAFFALDRLLSELMRLAESFTSGGGMDGVSDYISNLTSNLPFIRDIREKSGSAELWESIDRALADTVRKAMSELGAYVPRLAARIAASLPELFVFLTVALISGFFFASGSVDLAALGRVLPDGAARIYEDIRSRLLTALSGWCRAYLLIMGLTFLELFVGLSVLSVNYSFLIAFAVALVDILPVFGAGTVLVPWAVLMLLTGDRVMGVGLLVLWAVISVIRQFAEPRIVGKALGISPVLTLLSMYAGLRLFGIGGMIAAPALLMFARSFFSDKGSA